VALFRLRPIGVRVFGATLTTAAAAAEILFEMRASGGADGGALGDEEADMLTQLRVVCEDHLNVLARTVEGGGVTNEQILVRAIEVAEQLVAAIGDDEMSANVLAAAEADGGTVAGTTGAGAAAGAGAFGAGGNGGNGGGGEQQGMGALSSELAAVDLLGGLDVGGPPPPPPGAPAPAPAHTPPPAAAPAAAVAVPGRPTSVGEEEAMIMAAIAASLAESQPAEAAEASPGGSGGGGGGGGGGDGGAAPAPAAAPTSAPVGLPPPPPAAGGANLIDF
jgi:hypothetical protein